MRLTSERSGTDECVRDFHRCTPNLDRTVRRERKFITWCIRLLIIFSKQAMRAHTKRTAGNFHSEYLVLFYVVIDSTTINVDDLRGTRNAYHFHIFTTARTPHLVAENLGRS